MPAELPKSSTHWTVSQHSLQQKHANKHAKAAKMSVNELFVIQISIYIA
jgi:hypothetical protein